MRSYVVQFSMPHLVIWGKYDTGFLPQRYASFTELCVGVIIIELTDLDHWLNH
tara:strand:- start:279 stop:437 length:159 start_codon:yes stop_codon:yes gene_type:complete